MWYMVLTCSFYQLTCRQVWSWQQGEMAPAFLSAAQCGEAFHRLGVQDVAEFDSGWCSISTLWRKGQIGQKAGQREIILREEGFPRVGPVFLLCCVSQLLGAIKGWFECQSLNFFLHLMWWQLFWLEAVRITQVWLQHLREVFGVTELRLSAALP
jgi:hypothetical protein